MFDVWRRPLINELHLVQDPDIRIPDMTPAQGAGEQYSGDYMPGISLTCCVFLVFRRDILYRFSVVLRVVFHRFSEFSSSALYGLRQQ